MLLSKRLKSIAQLVTFDDEKGLSLKAEAFWATLSKEPFKSSIYDVILSIMLSKKPKLSSDKLSSSSFKPDKTPPVSKSLALPKAPKLGPLNSKSSLFFLSPSAWELSALPLSAWELSVLSVSLGLNSIITSLPV